MTPLRKELYRKIEILTQQIINSDPIDLNNDLIYEGPSYLNSLIHFTFFISMHFIVFKC